MSANDTDLGPDKPMPYWHEKMEQVGTLIHDGLDQHNAKLTDEAFEALNQIQTECPPAEIAALSHYFRANAWANRLEERKTDTWAWEQPEIQAQILELRKAIDHTGFETLHRIRRCQILTNLANQMHTMGRFIEAVKLWDDALAIEPRFAMALGNRGVGLKHYAKALYDPGHASLHILKAKTSLTCALRSDAIFESYEGETQKEKFRHQAEEITRIIALNKIRDLKDWEAYSLGESSDEKAYRRWCLENRLFINPLNDLGSHAVAATDVLTLPTLTTGIDEDMPVIIGFFNQMKQEFASARYIFFEGWDGASSRDSGHFSDRHVLLYNTLDYPAYGLHMEKMKAGYRMAYSIFDKIAFFLNSYLGIGANPDRVNFRNLWYDTRKSKDPELLPTFTINQNWPLRGLFWLSKDFYETEFKQVTMPDAKAFADIRNYLEHKYLKLHESWASPAEMNHKGQNALSFYALSENDFQRRTIQLLRCVRDALIYLSLAVHHEEMKRHQEPAGMGLTAQMPLYTLDDDWKR